MMGNSRVPPDGLQTGLAGPIAATAACYLDDCVAVAKNARLRGMSARWSGVRLVRDPLGTSPPARPGPSVVPAPGGLTAVPNLDASAATQVESRSATLHSHADEIVDGLGIG